MYQWPRATTQARVPTSATDQAQTTATAAVPQARSTRRTPTIRARLFSTPTSSIHSTVWHTRLQARSCPAAETHSVSFPGRPRLAPSLNYAREAAVIEDVQVSTLLGVPRPWADFSFAQLISQLTSVRLFAIDSTHDRSF